jgi:hypothetical protein
MEPLWKWAARILQWPFAQRQKRLMRSRTGHTPTAFVDVADDDDIAKAVLDALEGEAVLESFVPHPDDDLLEVYGIADEDLDDLVLKLLKKCDCRIPVPDETRDMEPVRTAGDLVRFISEMRASR